MSFQGPNLARQPFVNLRPIRRAAWLLWVAAIGLAAWNSVAYLRSGAGAAEKAATLESLNAEIVATRARIETLDADLRRADLERANLRTGYLNDRLAERAFSWNQLLDRLVDTMPRGVRVRTLTPEGFRDAGARRVTRTSRTAPVESPAERKVLIQVEGEAEDSEALLELIDRMFAHPAFDRPNLAREARTKTGALEFSLEVGYLLADPLPPPGGPDARVAASAPISRGSTGVVPEAASSAAGAAPRVVAAEAPGAAASARPERPAAGVDRTRSAAAAAPPRGPAAATDGAVDLADPTTPPGGRARAGAAAPPAAENLSIFGVPLSASPYASGAGR